MDKKVIVCVGVVGCDFSRIECDGSGKDSVMFCGGWHSQDMGELYGIVWRRDYHVILIKFMWGSQIKIVVIIDYTSQGRLRMTLLR